MKYYFFRMEYQKGFCHCLIEAKDPREAMDKCEKLMEKKCSTFTILEFKKID